MSGIFQILRIVFSFIRIVEKSKPEPKRIVRPAEDEYVPKPPPEPAPEPKRGPSPETLKAGWSKSIEDCHDNLRQVFPIVQARFLAKHPDLTMRCDYTWRSPEFQHKLFEKGRAFADGEWKIFDKSQVVTYVDGTVKRSHHNPYPSQALDFIIFRNKKPLWGTKDKPENFALYVEIGKMFEEHGLISGATWKYNWKDAGHLQVAYSIV